MAMALRAAQAASLAGPRVAPLRRSRAAPRHAAARSHVCRANMFDKLKEIIPSVSRCSGCARSFVGLVRSHVGLMRSHARRLRRERTMDAAGG